MNYRRRSDKGLKRKLWILFFVLVFLVLLVLLSQPIYLGLSRTFNFVGYPLWQAKVFSIGKGSVFGAIFKSKLRQAEKIGELKEELEKAELALKDLEIVKQENNDLKSLLDRENLSQAIPALVLSRPPQTIYDTFIIDAGKEDGLKGGEKVSFENVLLGEVIEVFSKTAKVKLFSSSETETAAFIERIKLPIVVKGRGGGNFEAQVPQDTVLEIGDFLTVPGVSQKLLGQIEEIEQIPTKSFKRILFKFPVNIFQLKWVAVEES